MMKFSGNKRNAKHCKPRKSSGGKPILIVGLVLLLLVGAGFAAYHAVVRPVPQKTEPRPQIQTPVDEQTGEDVLVEAETPQAHREGVYNILLCGTDDDGFRTDTIIVAHMDTNTHEAALLSIPRDSAVMQKDKLLKINSVYAGGKEAGMQRLNDCLHEMLGFPMDGYVLINLDAFCEVIDLMGGVWFDVPQDMFYEDPTQDLYIDLKAGRQLLDGENAMGLVRYRKGYNSQDIQRTKVQQEFLLAAAKQMLTLDNLVNIQKFAEIFAEHVTTDMTVGNLVYFAKEAASCDAESVQTYTPDGETAVVDGLWYYPLIKKSVLTIVNQSFNPYEADLTEDKLHILSADDLETDEQKAEEAEIQTPPSADVPEELVDQLDEFGLLPEDWHGTREVETETEDAEIGDPSLWEEEMPEERAIEGKEETP